MVSDIARTIARARRRNVEQSKTMADDENRFEKESRAFYNRVLAAYMAIAKRVPHRVVPVDATDAVAKVQKKIVGIVEERLLSGKPISKQKTT
jgi:thymidylate kinase